MSFAVRLFAVAEGALFVQKKLDFSMQKFALFYSDASRTFLTCCLALLTFLFFLQQQLIVICYLKRLCIMI